MLPTLPNTGSTWTNRAKESDRYKLSQLKQGKFEDPKSDALGLRTQPTQEIKSAILNQYNQMGSDDTFEEISFGIDVLNNLRESFPDNKDYRRAITVDITTGELIYPRFKAEDLAMRLRQHPSFHTPQFSVMKHSEFTKYVEDTYPDLILRPEDVTFYDVFHNTVGEFFDGVVPNSLSYAAQTWDFLVKGADYLGYGLHKATQEPMHALGFIPDPGEYKWSSFEKDPSKLNLAQSIVTTPGRWSDKLEQEKAELRNQRGIFDPEYMDYHEWATNTPLWTNMGDPLVWSRVVMNAAPSLMVSLGTTGTAYQGARLLGYGRSTSRNIALKTGFATTTLLEGGSELQGSIAYYTQPIQISEEEFVQESDLWKKDYLDEYYIVDEGVGKASFPDIQGDLDSQTKPTRTKRQMDSDYSTWMDANYYFDSYNYWKKGLSAADAMDKGILSAILYGPIAGALETMQASRFFDMLPGGWGTQSLKSKLTGTFGSKIDRAMRRIPFTNKILQIPESSFGKIINMAVTEGMEEFAQYTSQAIINSGLPLVAYKEEFEYDWNEAFESFAGGFVMGGGMQTGATILNKTGVTDYLANRSRLKDPPKGFTEFYVKKQEDGTWGLFYSDMGTETQLKTGDPGIVQDSFDTFKEANDAAKILRKEQRSLEAREHIRLSGELIGRTITKPVFNKETKKWEFEILDKEGNRSSVETFDTVLSAKKAKINYESNIKFTEDVAKEQGYTPEDINVIMSEKSEDTISTEEGKSDYATRKNTVFLRNYLGEVLSENEVAVEEELINEGRIPTSEGPMSQTEKQNYQNSVLEAIADERAIADSGLNPQEIIDEVKQDFGPEAANKAAEILKQGPPQQEDVGTPPIAPSPAPDSKPQVSPQEDVVEEGPPTTKEKKIDEMSIKELNAYLKKYKGKKDPQSKIRVKAAKSELTKRQKKLAKKTITDVRKKHMERKIAKVRNESVKALMSNILEGKKGPALIKDIAVDEKVIETLIDWVDSQRAVMGDQWTDSAMMQLMSLSMAYAEMQQEADKEAKKKTKQDVKDDLKPIKDTDIKKGDTPQEIGKKRAWYYYNQLLKDGKGARIVSRDYGQEKEDILKQHHGEEAAQAYKEEIEAIREFEINKKQKDAPPKTVHVGNVDKYVTFPPAKNRDEAHALIDGEKVPLTEKEKDKLQNLQTKAEAGGNWGLLGNLQMREVAVNIYNRYMAEKQEDAPDLTEEDIVASATGKVIEQKPIKPLKSRTQERKEAVKRDIDDIVKQLKKIIILKNNKPLKVKYIDDKNAPRGEWDGVNTITINLAKADTTTPIHEFMHPFIESLFVHNTKRFDEMYEQLKGTKVGGQVIEWVSSEYGPDHYLFKVEVVVESIARTARMKAPKRSNSFVDIVTRFLEWLKSIFFKNAGHIDTYNIKPGITVAELAKMLDNYHSPPLIEVLNTQETDKHIASLASEYAKRGVNVKTVDVKSLEEEIESLPAQMEDLYVKLMSEKIADSLDKNGKLNGNKAKKNFKTFTADFIENLENTYTFLDVAGFKKRLEDLSKKDRDGVNEFFDKVLDLNPILQFKDISKYLPSITDEEIDTIALIKKDIFTSINFKYKFVDFLNNNPDKVYNIKDLHKLKKTNLKKNETVAVIAFQKWIKDKYGDKITALKANRLKEVYLEFVRENYGMHFLEVSGYEGSLHLKDVFTFEDLDISDNKRILLTGDYIHKTRHTFHIPPESNPNPDVFDNFNGLGWFAYNIMGSNKDILLFEFQTDVIQRIKHALEDGRLTLSFEEGKKKWENRTESIPEFLAYESIYESIKENGDFGTIDRVLMLFGVRDPSDSPYTSSHPLKKLKQALKQGKTPDNILKNNLYKVDDNFVKAGLLTHFLTMGALKGNEIQKILASNKDMAKALGSRIWTGRKERVMEALIANPKLLKKLEPFLKKYVNDEYSVNYKEQISHRLDSLKNQNQRHDESQELSAFWDTDYEFAEDILTPNEYDTNKREIEVSERQLELIKTDFLSYIDISITAYLNQYLGQYLNIYLNADSISSGMEIFESRWKEAVEEGLTSDKIDEEGNIVKDKKTLKSRVLSDRKYGVPGAVPMTLDLWKNWFDILIKTSIGFSQNKKTSDTSIYLNTGNFIAALEGTVTPRQIYMSAAEAKIDNFMRMISEDETGKYADAEKKIWDFFAKGKAKLRAKFSTEGTKLPEFEAVSLYAGHIDAIPTSELLNIISPYNKDLNEWISIKKEEDADATKNMTPYDKRKYHAQYSNPNGGPWFQSLLKLEKQGIIKLSIERPNWSKWDLYKLEVLKPNKIVPNRFQKELKKSKDARFEPKNEAEAYNKVGRVSRYQLDETDSRTTRFEANQIFEGALKDVRMIVAKRFDPWDFHREMLNHLPTDLLKGYFKDWFMKKFSDASKMSKIREAKKSNSGFIANPEDVDSAVLSLFNEGSGIREGIDSLIEDGESDERDVGINELQWMEELGVTLTNAQLAAIKGRARTNYQKNRSFEDFTKQLSPYIRRKRGFDSLNDRQKKMTLRFYNRINSYVFANNPEGIQSTINERHNYVVIKSYRDKKGNPLAAPIIEFKFKDGENLKTGAQNPRAEKITLFEAQAGLGLFSWIGKEDYLSKSTRIDKFSGDVIEEYRDMYGWLPFNEVKSLNSLLKEQDLTIAFMRGENRRLALVDISQAHKDDFKNLAQYVSREFEDGYLPEESTKYFETPADIAIHEAHKKVWPLYLHDKKGSANVMKRMKIPFTPVTTTKNIPNFDLKVFDPSKASFVFNDGTGGPAMVNIKGLGKKYINDGGSMASFTLWSHLVHHGGVSNYSGSNKNVIYYKKGDSTLMVKHEMSQVERDLEIWYNKGQADEQLIAKVDSRGNISDANDNNIDLLMTPDEAKVFDGEFAVDNIYKVPGRSIGFIGYRDKASRYSTHGTQWYSYIENDEIIQSYQDNIIKEMDVKLANFWNISRDTEMSKSYDKIKSFLVDKLDRMDNDGYRHSLIEHAKVGAGRHKGMEPMLDVLLQSKGMKQILRASLQAGTKSKIVGNLRHDLKPNEIALSRANASYVISLYKKDTNDSKAKTSDVNDWLKKNEVKAMVTRYPVPHVGGVMMARVKRIHHRFGLIEMNPFDVYAKLEGDMDGDEVHVEFLKNKDHTKLIDDYLSVLNIEAINLNNYPSNPNAAPVFQNADGTLTVLDDNESKRIAAMGALAFGGNAIGEIANLINVYGQLRRVFDYATIDGNKIVMRKLDEEVVHPGLNEKMPLRKALRLYLQAALDNAEFSLLYEWDYNLPSLYSLLFKRDDGKSFQNKEFLWGNQSDIINEGTRVYQALRPLINIHKVVGRLRKGYDFEDGKYGLSDVIKISEQFYNYTLNRVQGFNMEQARINKNGKEMYPANIEVGFLEKLSFKEGDEVLVSPWEMSTIAPYRTMQEHIFKHKRRGYGDTLFKINETLHENSHTDSVKMLDSRKEDILNRAYQVDLSNGLVKVDKKSYLTLEKNKGLVYRTAMATAWYNALVRVDKVGPQTIDRNDAIREMALTYDKKFKNLSKTAKVIATIGFLEGFITLSDKLSTDKFAKLNQVEIATVLPHVSKSAFELQLLDESILQMFYNEYNKLISNPLDTSFVEGRKRPEYRAFDMVITRMCR